MQENLSAPAQNLPPDVKRYNTKEFAEVTGLSVRTIEDLRSKRKGRLMPAGYDEKGKAFYTADQINEAKQFCRPAKKLPPVDKVVSLFDSPPMRLSRQMIIAKMTAQMMTLTTTRPPLITPKNQSRRPHRLTKFKASTWRQITTAKLIRRLRQSTRR